MNELCQLGDCFVIRPEVVPRDDTCTVSMGYMCGWIVSGIGGRLSNCLVQQQAVSGIKYRIDSDISHTAMFR